MVNSAVLHFCRNSTAGTGSSLLVLKHLLRCHSGAIRGCLWSVAGSCIDVPLAAALMFQFLQLAYCASQVHQKLWLASRVFTLLDKPHYSFDAIFRFPIGSWSKHQVCRFCKFCRSKLGTLSVTRTSGMPNFAKLAQPLYYNCCNSWIWLEESVHSGHKDQQPL